LSGFNDAVTESTQTATEHYGFNHQIMHNR